MDSQNATQAPTTAVADILDTAEGFELVDGKLVPWAPVVGERKLTRYSKMKCPLCGMIVGVSYSGKRFLAIHTGGKKCLQAQRKLNPLEAPKPSRGPAPKSAHVSELKKPASDDWTGIREYYKSLGLLRNPKPKAKLVPTAQPTTNGSSSGFGWVSPVDSDSSMLTLVEDVLLTPPLVPMDSTSLPPALSLPPPTSFVPEAKPIAPAPQVAPLSLVPERDHGSSLEHNSGRDRMPRLEDILSHEPEPLLSHPIPKRAPTPIVIDDSSDDESDPAPVPSAKHGYVKYVHGLEPTGIELPPTSNDSECFVLQAGLVNGEMKCWDEMPEGQRFLAMLRETVGKTE
ncbi:hypothetical protein FRC07_011176 [Ceratobasidium sp. 392]|nr:hypothetical protein FRC07_011176 [Ceratobasidium sp. 392]